MRSAELNVSKYFLVWVSTWSGSCFWFLHGNGNVCRAFSNLLWANMWLTSSWIVNKQSISNVKYLLCRNFEYRHDSASNMEANGRCNFQQEYVVNTAQIRGKSDVVFWNRWLVGWKFWICNLSCFLFQTCLRNNWQAFRRDGVQRKTSKNLKLRWNLHVWVTRVEQLHVLLLV